MPDPETPGNAPEALDVPEIQTSAPEPAEDEATTPSGATAERAMTLRDRFGALRPAWKGLVAFGCYLAASVWIWGRPVLDDFSTRYVGVGKGDSKLYQWSMQWTPWAIEHGMNPFFTDRVFAPGGADLTWTTFMPGPALVAWPITRVFGPLAAYNTWMVLAPALMAWGAYLVCRRVTHRFLPSLVGGFLFGFSAYMSGQMHGHMNLVLAFPVPLAVYLVIRRVEGSLRTVWFVVLLFLALLGLFSISTEIFATATLFGVIAFAVALVFGGPARMRVFRTGLWVAATYAIVALALLPVLLQAFDHAPLKAVRPATAASVDLLSFVLPRRAMLLIDPFQDISVRFTAAAIEDAGYLTVPLVVMLALFGFKERRSRVTWGLLAFILIGATLALGPVLHIGGRAIVGEPLGEFVTETPLLEHATPQRFPIYVALAVSVVAAIWLARARGRWAWASWGLVLLGVVMLIPDVSTPPFHPDRKLEPFFAEGMYRDSLEPGEIVLAIPEIKNEEMLWQASSDFWFRMPQGYVGPIPKEYVGEVANRGLALIQPRPYTPSPDKLSAWLHDHEVNAIVMADPAEERFGELVQEVGFQPVERLGGVSIWRRPGT